MTQLQEAIRDKITTYSDACGMCTDTTKDCDTCGITCMLEDLNELQRLANRQDAVRPTAHLENEDNLFGAQNASQTITPTSDRIRQLADILENKHNAEFVTIDRDSTAERELQILRSILSEIDKQKESIVENAVAQALTFDKLLHGSDEKIDESVDKRSEVQDSIVSIRYNMIGRRYRHFKGSIYIVDGIAVHSETTEPLVIYHEEHERNRMWARPLSMFLSPVDKKKYPDATQEMRFEKIYGE